MGRPKKSTRDAWLDEFADVPADVQENWLEMAEFVHRQSKRQAAKASRGKEDGVEQIPLGERDSG